MIDRQSDSGGRRSVTLVIRVFMNEDGSHYGVISDPGATGETEGWQATFAGLDELIARVHDHLAHKPGKCQCRASER